MRIEAVSGGTTNQQQTQTQKTRQQGMESKPVEIVKNKPEAVLQNETIHAEAQVAAEELNQQNEKKVIQEIEKANKHIRIYDRRLEFSIHDTTKHIMVKVIDTSDDSIIREIPSEKILDMVGRMWEESGILVDEKR